MWQEIRSTLKLGWPIILGNLTHMLLGVIDNAMVGAIHSSQLAAASFVNNIISLPLIIGTGLSMAISQLVASAQGEGDNDKPLRILYNGLWVVISLALLLAITVTIRIDLVFYMGQDEIVARLSQPYLRWMIWGTVPMVIFMAMKHFTDGLGYTRIPMYIALMAIPVNILVNYAFIYGKWGAPRMELEGAGVGTLVSRVLIMIALAILIFKSSKFALYRQHLSEQLTIRRDRLMDVLRIGVPSGLQYGMESASFAVSGIMSGWLGYVQQAAHQITLSLAAITFMVSLGISAAGSIRVAFASGRKEWKWARQIGVSTLWMAVGYGVLCALIFIGFRQKLPLLFNDEGAVVAYASSLLILAAAFQISDSVQAVGVGILRGLQDVKVPTLFVGIAYWVMGIPFGYVLSFILGWEIIGIWTGFLIGLSFSAVLLSYRFLRITGSKYAAKQARKKQKTQVSSGPDL